MTRRKALTQLSALVLLVAFVFSFTMVKGYRPFLGLDLQGGVSVVLKAQAPSQKDAVAEVLDALTAEGPNLGIGEVTVTSDGTKVIVTPTVEATSEQLDAAVTAVEALVDSLSLGDASVTTSDGTIVVDVKNVGVADDAIDQSIKIIRTRVDALGVAEPEITRQGKNVIIQIPGVKDPEAALALVGQTAELRFRPVLQGPYNVKDLEAAQETTSTTVAGGESTTTTTVAGGESTTTTTTVAGGESTTTTTTVADATTTTAGDTTTSGAGRSAPVRMQDPSTTTTDPTATTTDPTATTADPAVAADPTATTLDPTAPADPTATTLDPTATTLDPTVATDPTSVDPGPPLDPTKPTAPEDDAADAMVILPAWDDPDFLYVLGPTLATGSVLAGATADLDQNGQWIVRATFKPGKNGNDLFNSAAGSCFNKDPNICPTGALAIVLDHEVISAPSINAATFDGSAQITGNFTEKEANDLALVLRYGALPVELTPQTIQKVSATLGEDALHAALLSGAVAFLAVLFYMVFFYRALGGLAILKLIVEGALLWAVICLFGEFQGLALTLAGITGIIVSIGVSLDSNIVYYEHLKEDVLAGRTLRSTVDRSFSSAFSTILKADFASLIGAGLLWWLTVGPVRGFAFYLGLSTLLDIICSRFYMHPVIWLAANSRLGRARPSVLGMPATPGGEPSPETGRTTRSRRRSAPDVRADDETIPKVGLTKDGGA